MLVAEIGVILAKYNHSNVRIIFQANRNTQYCIANGTFKKYYTYNLRNASIQKRRGIIIIVITIISIIVITIIITINLS